MIIVFYNFLVPDDIEEFHRSFLVKNTEDKCDVEESKLSDKKSYGIIEEESNNSSEESLWEEIERSEKSQKKEKNGKWRKESESAAETRKFSFFSNFQSIIFNNTHILTLNNFILRPH